MIRAAVAVWRFSRRYPYLILILMIGAQTLPALEARWFWFSDEVRYAEVYANLIGEGRWVLLELNGAPYPDKPPLYFLLLAALDQIPGIGMPGVMFLGSAVTGPFLLIAVDRLGAAVGLTQPERVAGMLATLCLFAVILHLHYVRMDLLFVALMLWCQTLLYRYHLGEERPAVLLAGYAMGGLSVLVKGPLGLVLPMLAVWAVAVWAGQGRRILGWPTLAGLAVALGVILTWALGIVLVEGWSYLTDEIIGRQVVARATEAFHHSEPWTYYFLVLPLLMLPWTGMLASLPWGRAVQWPGAIWSGRRAPGPATALGAAALVHFAVLSSLDGKVAIYVLPIMAQLALLVGGLSLRAELRAGWVGSGLLMALCGAGLLWLALAPAGAGLRLGAAICGTGLVLYGAALALFGRAGGPTLAALSLGLSAWSLALALWLLPGLNDRASTRLPAEIIARYADEGYTPVAYKTYPGIYSYYAGRDLLQIEEAENLRALAADGGPMVVAARRERWEGLGLDGFEVVDDRPILGAGPDYLVLVRPAP